MVYSLSAWRPPVSIAGWSVNLTVAKRFMSTTSLLSKSMASGYYGVSGMNIQNSGAGIMTAQFNSQDTSGWGPGNYACSIERVDSGAHTELDQGLLIIGPTVLQQPP